MKPHTPREMIAILPVTASLSAALKGTQHKVVADRIEAGTYAIAAAAATGNVLLQGARFEHLGALIKFLRDAGVEVDAEARGLRVKRKNGRLNAVDFDTTPFPGFPTDLQAQAMALMCMADGRSRSCGCSGSRRLSAARWAACFTDG